MKEKITFVTQQELATLRPFTLTSGYHSENTKFVRVRDGYSIGADPALLRDKKRPGEYRHHHIFGEGYLYREFPGYVMATTKAGCRGYSEWVSIPTPAGFSRFITFNPFIGEKVIIQELFERSREYGVSRGWSIISVTIFQSLPEEVSGGTYESFFDEEELLKEEPLGRWHLPVPRVGGDDTYYSTGSVRGIPFKGIRNLLERLSASHKERFIFRFNDRNYSQSLGEYQIKGEVKTSSSKGIKDLFEENFFVQPGFRDDRGDIFFETPEKGVFLWAQEENNKSGVNYPVFGLGNVYRVFPENFSEPFGSLTPIGNCWVI